MIRYLPLPHEILRCFARKKKGKKKKRCNKLKKSDIIKNGLFALGICPVAFKVMRNYLVLHK